MKPVAPVLVVFGAGGHGKVVASVLLAAGEVITGFVDDGAPVGSIVLGLPVLGPMSWLDASASASAGASASQGGRTRVALGIGDNAARARVADAILSRGGVLATAIHPRAVVDPSARIEDGVAIMALAVVNADAIVARGAIVNTAAIIEHDCTVGAYAHVSPNAVMGGACALGTRSQLGIGATMLPGTAVGNDVVVGGGAVVTRPIPDDAVAKGVPARWEKRRKVT